MRYVHSLGKMKGEKMGCKLNSPWDYVYIVLCIVELLLVWDKPENEDTVKMPYLVVESNNDIKRAFIVKSNQIVSFAFPFDVSENVDSTGICTYRLNYRDMDISAEIVSKCMSLYTNMEDERKGKRTFAEIVSDENQQDEGIRKAIVLFEMLMLSEPAYIRYDYDKIHAVGLKHPECHFDCNFVKTNHYKIGLNNCVGLKQIKDLMNKTTNCWFIDKYRAEINKNRLNLRSRKGRSKYK